MLALLAEAIGVGLAETVEGKAFGSLIIRTLFSQLSASSHSYRVRVGVNINKVHSDLSNILKRHEKAINAALLSESYRISKEMKAYARRHPWRQAPITKMWRKSSLPYGRWFARNVRYAIDKRSHFAKVGLLDSEALSGMSVYTRFKPISRGYARNARKLAAGYAFNQTRGRQKAMYARLYGLKSRNGRRRVSRARGVNMVPSVGWHAVRPRPIARAVLMRQRSKISRNIEQKYWTKFKNPGARV